MWIKALIIFGCLALFFLVLLAIAYWISAGSRSNTRLINYKTRVSESPFTIEEIDLAFQKLDAEWSKLDPKKSKQVNKLLNRISINWRPRRWTTSRIVDGEVKHFRVNAEFITKTKLAVWIGPKLPTNNRKIYYTSLYIALVKAILFNVYGIKDPDVRPYAQLIRNLNKSMKES